MPKLVLASASPRRIELLKQIGLEFTVKPADVDESAQSYTDAGKYAAEMSERKALFVATKLHDSKDSETYVLGADTTVEIDGNILGKPVDYDDAARMLDMIQGRWHRVFTGVTMVNCGSLEVSGGVECTRVKIISMDRDMIDRYLSTGEAFDKAGSYGIQGYGSLIVERIEGCFFNVMGLPIHRLSVLLEKQGFKMLSWIKRQV